MHTAAQLGFLRAHRHQAPWQAAYDQLLAEAEAGLARTPDPPEDFNVPFYYANPEASQAAKVCLEQDAAAAYALALGYQLADTCDQRRRYGDQALELLDAWAGINRSVSGADGDLVVIYKGVLLLYAADLVMGYEGWDDTRRAAFAGWVRAVFWPSADAIKERANNWGDWGTLGAIASAALLRDQAGVAGEVERIRARIETSIAESGELPEENLRTNSGMWYTFFALTSLTTAVHIARNASGEDLFAYTAPNGRSIRLALDRYFVYCLEPEQWPYLLPDGLAGELWQLLYPCADEVLLPTPTSWPGNLFEAMSDVYQVQAWEDWVSPYRPQRGWHGWIYATLGRGTP